ncbi:osmoprotectant transport system ATP-binding protein [Enterococcus sp. PF1-24]|uniref:ABC transporter ATP-binding protein n=1 Tax=unclassified Enterococcus TaxID=2608891 RepID=UPI002473C4DF|nr:MULTISPECIES: ABC transporter ATP-binding protein [unclassified Enterococcus]MDH6364396.1 osmoprotectant transport system ATP-binding protein [Enterococcus sp. PFB1-1]MDH6401415.1 osmoprotectant transport system ATP-binding protein [Enterococcus sp. PF1-24]
MKATAIEFQNVSKCFDNANKNAVNNLNLTIQEGEFITILGSSGCGKTTLLKMINKLYEPDTGEILIFGKNSQQLDAVELRRGIGYVIQQVGLFPHMTIQQNIALLPKILKWEPARIEKLVDDLLTMVELAPAEYKNRFPSQLSGGQQQRVGLARALAADPAIMLFDEPFGAIDAITRTMLQDEILRIHYELQKTFVFVTHDINEAFKLGNRVIVMNGGQVLQFDTPEKIIQQPADPFVEKLIQSAITQQEFWGRYK